MLQNATQALNQCMQTTSGTPDAKKLAKRAKELAEDGKIDPLAGLADDNVYLFSGNEDQTVTRPVVEAAAAFLKDAGVKETNLTLVEKEGGHAFITAQGGAACGITATPYVTDCDYDQAQRHPRLDLWPPRRAFDRARRAVHHCSTSARSQTPATVSPTRAWSMCRRAAPSKLGCRVHIALHGCEQSRETVGDDFIKTAGYAEIADTNRLIILFPQTKPSTGINPHGCWDWWGYTDLDYLGKDAPQIKAIWAMVEQLATRP